VFVHRDPGSGMGYENIAKAALDVGRFHNLLNRIGNILEVCPSPCSDTYSMYRKPPNSLELLQMSIKEPCCHAYNLF
jgi:hypothetical protein